jgi:hypothetical protein
LAALPGSAAPLGANRLAGSFGIVPLTWTASTGVPADDISEPRDGPTLDTELFDKPTFGGAAFGQAAIWLGGKTLAVDGLAPPPACPPPIPSARKLADGFSADA